MNPGDKEAEQFKEASEAYAVLSDLEKADVHSVWPCGI